MADRAHNFTRAQLKKARKSFKVGDLVTWGYGAVSCRVLEVRSRGVIVDAQIDGKPRRLFVAYDGNVRGGYGGRHVRHPTAEDLASRERFARMEAEIAAMKRP